jgi:hypothetical protein
MTERAKLAPELVADVLMLSRRRCCLCFALDNDAEEKKGQIAHLDRDRDNNDADNLAFLCFDHHDEYDSRTSQAKGLTLAEVKRYRAALHRHVHQSLPLSDMQIAKALLTGLDRPAFRTPFRAESSLPRFRAAIEEAIANINTGIAPSGVRLPGKNDLQDVEIRRKLDAIVEKLVALRTAFDNLQRTGEIRHCGCGQPDCPTYMLSDAAADEMDERRLELLHTARLLGDLGFEPGFYSLADD